MVHKIKPPKELDGISAKAFEEYETVRASGMTNMFDRRTVREIADKLELNALKKVIDEGNYSKFFGNYDKALKLGMFKRL